MDHDLLDEHEREDLVRQWIKENVPVLIFGAALGLGGVFGWRYYQERVSGHRQLAATEFKRLLDSEAPSATTALLDSNYDDTPYTALADMVVAQSELKQKSVDAAIERYRNAIEVAPNRGLKLLAQIRLAKLLTAAKRYQESVQLLDSLGEPAGFISLIHELKGDVMRAQGKRDQAIEAYRQALATLDAAAGNRRTLQMKLEDLGVDAKGVSG